MSEGLIAKTQRSSLPTYRFRYTDDRSRVEMVYRCRDSALRGNVTALWGLDENCLDPIFRRHVPGATTMLCIGFGSLPLLTRVNSTQTFQQPPVAFLAGPTTVSVLSRSVPGMRFLMVELTPLAAFSLLGGPLQEVRNSWVDLADLRPAGLRWLPEQLNQAQGWPERFDLVEDALRTALDDAPRPDPIVVSAWRRLAGDGPVGVERLADELGYSRRHLTRRFHQAVGLPPKATARLLRLRRAVALLRAGSPGGLAATAAACGYADQSHLNQEFRTIVGTTPTAFQSESRGASRQKWAAGCKPSHQEGFLPSAVTAIDLERYHGLVPPSRMAEPSDADDS
jgi:AraC-like DNA-binding protein